MHLAQVHPRPQTLDPAFTKMYWIEPIGLHTETHSSSIQKARYVLATYRASTKTVETSPLLSQLALPFCEPLLLHQGEYLNASD